MSLDGMNIVKCIKMWFNKCISTHEIAQMRSNRGVLIGLEPICKIRVGSVGGSFPDVTADKWTSLSAHLFDMGYLKWDVKKRFARGRQEGGGWSTALGSSGFDSTIHITSGGVKALPVLYNTKNLRRFRACCEFSAVSQ